MQPLCANRSPVHHCGHRHIGLGKVLGVSTKGRALGWSPFMKRSQSCWRVARWRIVLVVFKEIDALLYQQRSSESPRSWHSAATRRGLRSLLIQRRSPAA